MTKLLEVASPGRTKNILIWIIWGGYFTTSCPLILLLQIVGNVHWTEKTEQILNFLTSQFSFCHQEKDKRETHLF